MGLWVRFMIKRDMPEVLGIEARSFANPWSERDFLRVLRIRNCVGLVLEDGQAVLGYVVYELSTTTVTILNLAVAPDRRRLGVGTALVGNLVAKLKSRGREEILAEVRERNLAGQLFFRAAGFSCVEVLPEHYDESDEDAYVFQYLHPESPFSPVAYAAGGRA